MLPPPAQGTKAGQGSIRRRGDNVVDLWWEGIGRWYNERDYLSAMECWNEALTLWQKGTEGTTAPRLSRHSCREEPEDSKDGACHALERALGEADSTSEPHNDSNTTSSPPGGSFPASLWLFLAGCLLDAQDYPAARRALLACFRDCARHLRQPASPNNNNSSVSDVLQRALAEYIASFEEDPEARDDTGSATPTNRSSFSTPPPSMGTRIAAIVLLQSHRLPTAWTDPLQRPGFVYPHVHSQPLYQEMDQPAWCRALEGCYPAVRDEFDRLTKHSRDCSRWPRVGDGAHRGGAGSHDGRVVAPAGGDGDGSRGGDWRECVLFGSGEVPGVAPITQAWLQSHVPDAVELARAGGGEIIFSVLAPFTRLRPHCATTNLRLTAHLGLVVPPPDATAPCRIRVADRWETWEEGKVLVFDDSYEHEVENLTNLHRAVLLIRFWHPSVPPEERSQSLDQALRGKQREEIQRFHPPLPGFDDASPVRRRALEESHCHKCGRCGIEGLRVSSVSPTSLAATHAPMVRCACGESIT